MIKRNLLVSALLILLSLSVNAQFTVSSAASYIRYFGDLNRGAPTAQARVSYDLSDRIGLSLAYGGGMWIEDSYVVEGETIDTRLDFSFINLTANYHLKGAPQDDFSFYLPFSASYGISKFNLDHARESVKEKGLTLNAGLGTHFRVGIPWMFIEAGAAVPVGKAIGTRREGVVGNSNPIPLHGIISIGLKCPIPFE